MSYTPDLANSPEHRIFFFSDNKKQTAGWYLPIAIADRNREIALPYGAGDRPDPSIPFTRIAILICATEGARHAHTDVSRIFLVEVTSGEMI